MKALFLVRTPLHAFLAKAIIIQEKISSAEIVCVATHDVRRSERYFLEASKVACRGFFFPHRGSAATAYINAVRSFPSWRWLLGKRYDRVYVASFHTWYFQALAGRAAEVCTFDDGSGNYTGAIDKLAKPHDAWLGKLLGGRSTEEIRANSAAHYAIRADLQNVFPKEKLRQIDLGIKVGNGGKPLTIAIGQPFRDYLSQEDTARIVGRLQGLPYYQHPREARTPEGVEAIYDSRILEHYVADMSKDHDITLVGAFTTAMITIPTVRKVYLDADGDPKRRSIMEAVGCEVERI